MYRKVNSPLLYYGGKKWLIDTILPLIPKSVDEVVSPFFGGGSIELNLALKGYRVKGYDIYKPLVNFWKFFLDDASIVIDKADKTLRKNTKDTLMTYDRLELVNMSGIDGAVWYYLFNHLSFNGCTSSNKSFLREFTVREHDNVMVFVDPHNRVVFSHRNTWENLPDINLTIENVEFESSLLQNENSFLYLDPPYPNNEKAYGEGDMMFDHELLFSMIESRDNWILSYDENELTNNLYKDYRKMKIKRNTRYNKYEYLFFSHDISDNIPHEPEQMCFF